jgi:hypothetical protein
MGTSPLAVRPAYRSGRTRVRWLECAVSMDIWRDSEARDCGEILLEAHFDFIVLYALTCLYVVVICIVEGCCFTSAPFRKRGLVHILLAESGVI